MLDSEYFRTKLQGDVDAIGGTAVVELHLTSGRSQRLRSVVSVEQGYVVLEAYRSKGGEISAPQWKQAPDAADESRETERTVAAYESIVSVHVTPADPARAPRVGFGAR